MPVTERLMQPGSFSFTLRPETPIQVRSAIQRLGHVIITTTEMNLGAITGATLRSLALYSGVVLGRSDGLVSGAGLEWWLGSPNHDGDALDTAVTLSAVTLSSALATLLPTTQPVAAGTIDNTGLNTITQTAQWVSRLAAVQRAVQLAGAEYRVRPTATLDAAAQAVLFPTTTTPTVILTRDAAYRESATLLGVPTNFADAGFDATQYATKVWLLAKAGDGAVLPSSSASRVTSYLDLRGNAVVLERLVDSPSTEAANAGNVANSVLNLSTLRNSVALSCDLYAPTRFIIPGDTVYVWDPDTGVVDTANQVQFRGITILPAKVRITGLTWPLEPGMGVYYRDSDGSYKELHRYIAWESEPSSTILDVGVQSAGSDDASVQFGFMSDAAEARLFTAPTNAWTPVLGASVTNPTMGTGGTPVTGGYYKIVDGQCTFNGSVQFGTTGVAAGSGNYRITGLPVVPKAGRSTFLSGKGRLTDASVPTTAEPHMLVDDSGVIEFRYPAAYPTGADTRVGAALPWTWAASDRLEFWGTFPVN